MTTYQLPFERTTHLNGMQNRLMCPKFFYGPHYCVMFFHWTECLQLRSSRRTEGHIFVHKERNLRFERPRSLNLEREASVANEHINDLLP